MTERDPRLPARPAPLPRIPPGFINHWRLIAWASLIFGVLWGVLWGAYDEIHGYNAGLVLQCGALALDVMLLAYRLVHDARELRDWFALRRIREIVLDDIERLTLRALNGGSQETAQRGMDFLIAKFREMARDQEELRKK
jgi:hypothetical protein